MPKKSKSIINLFVENEQKVSRLYWIYSKKFPLSQKFWKKIHKEELEHVELLEESKRVLKKSQSIIEENDYSRGIIEYIGKFISKELKKAQSKKIDAIEAIETALRLEQSMIEKKSFEMFMPTHPFVRKTFRKLNRDTERHARLLEKELRKNVPV